MAATTAAASAASAAAPLRLCQFNVLAPSARICRPLDKVPWQRRHEAICDFLLKERPDVVCLQEFDSEAGTLGFQKLYADRLGQTFAIFAKRRTRAKVEGLAVLLRREAFAEEGASVRDLELEPEFCDRVAQVARARHVASGRWIVVANTHLTVAHAHNNHDIPMCRPLQIRQVLEALGAPEVDDALVFLCADMNCDHLETEPPRGGAYTAEDVSKPVQMVFDAGFASALHELHPGVRPISHTCSYAQDGCADYIFFRPGPSARLSSARMYPEDLPPDTPWKEASGWGAAGGAPEALETSGTLSDHRPLLADFEVAATAAGQH